MAPAMKMTSATPRTSRLPVQSDRTPATRPPRSAPKVVEDVISSCVAGQLGTSNKEANIPFGRWKGPEGQGLILSLLVPQISHRYHSLMTSTKVRNESQHFDEDNQSTHRIAAQILWSTSPGSRQTMSSSPRPLLLLPVH